MSKKKPKTAKPKVGKSRPLSGNSPPEKMNERQLAFCESYVICWNATQAAKDAGYSEHTAKEMGYENLTKPHLKDWIQDFRANNRRKFKATIDDIEQWLLAVFYFDIRDANFPGAIGCNPLPFDKMPLEVRDVILETEKRMTESGWTYRIKSYSKMDAVDRLIKHFGFTKGKDGRAGDREAFKAALGRISERAKRSRK